MFRYAFTVLYLLVPSMLLPQRNIDLENKVEEYFAAENPTAQYDALASLMEFNASLSLSEAEYYHEKYNSQEYLKRDSRYSLLAHSIAADALYYADNADSSLFHYLSLFQKAKSMDENMFSASGLGNAAFLLSDTGDNLGALSLLKSNLHIARNTGDIRDYSDQTYNIAQFYSHLEIRDSAIHYFEKTVDTDRIANNRSGMLYNMDILLRKYLESNEVKKALSLALECVKISEEEGNSRARSQCCSSLAMTYEAMGLFEEAEKWISEAIKTDESRNDSTRMSSYYRIYGNISSRKENYSEADDHYMKSISLAEKYVSKEDQLSARLAYANSLYEQRKLNEALRFAREANSLVRGEQLNRYKVTTLNLLGNIELARGYENEALEYERQESKELSEQLAAKNLQAAEQSKNSFDLFQIETEKRALEIQKELAETKIRRRNNLIIAGALIILLASITTYFVFQNRMQRSRLQSSVLEFQVLEKELLALRSQMNPHFLFNSLNSINDYIMHEEPRQASRYLTKFSNLMRTILNNSKERLITLEAELKGLRLYIEMENMRFMEQFDYQEDIKVTSDQVKIPSMLLQPYIENAIKHGLRNSGSEGILRLSVKENAGKLEFEIYDNGVGREAAQRYKSQHDADRKSHGLNITNDRIIALNKIYNIDAELAVVDHYNPTGTSVFLTLKPYNDA